MCLFRIVSLLYYVCCLCLLYVSIHVHCIHVQYVCISYCAKFELVFFAIRRDCQLSYSTELWPGSYNSVTYHMYCIIVPNLKDTPKRRVMATTLVAPLVVKNTRVSFRPSVESSVLNKVRLTTCDKVHVQCTCTCIIVYHYHVILTHYHVTQPPLSHCVTSQYKCN